MFTLNFFLSALPHSLAMHLGEKLGALAGVVFSKRSRLAYENIKMAFPEFNESQIRKIVNEVWKNLGRTAVEFVRFSRINSSNYTDYFSFEGMDHVRNAAKKGNGIIFVTPHLNNWEIGGRVTAFWLGEIIAIARPIKNPFVEKWIQRKRAASNFKIILHRNAVRESLRVLAKKGCIAMLPDQNLYRGGVFVQFFNRPAATTTLPALLHSRTKAPVILGYSLREGNKFKVIYEPPINFPEIKEKKDRLQKYTQIITSHIEDVIRKYPEKWFWLHNRWKTQPEP